MYMCGFVQVGVFGKEVQNKTMKIYGICVRNLRSRDQGQQTDSHLCLHSPYLSLQKNVFCSYAIQVLCVRVYMRVYRV